MKTISKQAFFGSTANYDELVSKRELLQREVEVLQLLKGHKHVVQVGEGGGGRGGVVLQSGGE